MPGDIWYSRLCVYFRNRALSAQEAHDCAHEVFLRYTQHTDAPAWNGGSPPALLWQMAHDVLCECCRQRDQHARLQQRLIEHQRCVPPCDVEEMAIDAVDCGRFMAFLPDRLREVLQLRLQGYTYAEIAQALSLSEGTVKSYGAQLREKFRKYFGYDPTKSPSRFGNIDGGFSEEALQSPEKEEVHDGQGTGMDSGGAVRGKRVGSAPHARRARTARGGTAPCLPIVHDGCVDCMEGLPAPVPSQQRPATKGELKPLRAGCIDVYSQCVPMSGDFQYRCIDVFWPCDLFGGWHERQRRERAIWFCQTPNGGNVSLPVVAVG